MLLFSFKDKLKLKQLQNASQNVNAYQLKDTL